MDHRKAMKWLYIALAAVVTVTGIWVTGCGRDGSVPSATPTPGTPDTAAPTEAPTPEATPPATPPPGAPRDRDQAGDFSLPNLNGDTVALTDTQGKVTVINFWGAWCHWCMEEMPEFAEMAEYYEGQDVAFLFLNYGDDADTAKAAIEELGIPYEKVLMDTQDGEVMHLYDATYFPTTLILDKWGGVAERHEGYATKDDVMPVIEELLAE